MLRTVVGRWPAGTRYAGLALAGGFLALALELTRRLRRSRRDGRREAKAAEDRHIGFRWLKHQARLAREGDAEAVFRGVVAELGRRLGRDEGKHVAAHLPLGLRAVWDEETRGAGRPESSDAEELLARVQSRLGLERPEEAEVLVSIVLAWLKYLAPEESADAGALLPADLRELWDRAQLPLVPPWHRLELPGRALPRPVLAVRFITWEPGLAEPAEEKGEVFALPGAGERFWRECSAFRVERVEEGRTPHIHLVRDHERESRVHEGMPGGYVLRVEQADADGLWRAQVVGLEGDVAGSAQDDDCDAAAEAAKAEALRALAVAAGYHPEREVE